MQDSVNLKYLAQKLSLSVSTVSKALQDSHEISPATKDRVLTLARELHYTPNPYASSLRRKKSKTIAVVIPAVDDNFFSQVIKGVEAVAQQMDYHVLIYLTHESLEKEQAILQDFNSGRVDGVLISISTETTTYEHIAALSQHAMPVVSFDRTPGLPNLVNITTDDFESTYKATLHLIEHGSQRPVFLSISPNLSISQARAEGYAQAMKDQGMTPIEVIDCSGAPEQQYHIIHHVLQQSHFPDGIVASGEKLTLITYQVCQDLKRSIPEDIKVLGFFNLEVAPLLAPPLTTITQPCYAIGKTAANVLFKALKGKHLDPQYENQVIPSQLIVRTSTLPNHKK